LLGETAEQALSRELREEFDATIDIRRKLLTHVSDRGDAYPGTYSVFVADLVTPVAGIQCREGIAVGFFSPFNALRFRQHPVADFALRKFLSRAW
jgi:ADP-ribose pyrophosphatase YjhB (NUDIX family)